MKIEGVRTSFVIYRAKWNMILDFVVTNKFADANFSRPRLAVFAFASQNKNIAVPSTNTKKFQAVGIF
ncbi:MAG: hypothetical protein COV33_00905 [Candidatus Zambryskibacteria bacterium CG10_big_fil_rev_8_21_14_0_10_34_34]|uniref:Uncharacterized protein n=1 Tax=Candidatus Zambryskibacteria bacterium CG10_big_fil_rev_8_21_14_0_10_34_34 TaxID=1975114 RepID=A0A2H0R133_9BACT|nr:MAG: hypothetical protein COV33_00905 [Candidatus Zambryskibacteria bacterium CG10_big_fil_rev_8_21_14_0_10_34_34]